MIIAAIFASTVITSQSLVNTEQYGNKYYTFMETYREPMLLGINYYSHILNVGDQTYVDNQIKLASDKMIKAIGLPGTTKTIFDREINKPQNYYPFKADSINRNTSYNQVDLFYLIGSNIAALQTLPIDRHGFDFNMFNSYIKPSYDLLINGTKNEFHFQF